jgi:hypothetical protein
LTTFAQASVSASVTSSMLCWLTRINDRLARQIDRAVGTDATSAGSVRV